MRRSHGCILFYLWCNGATFPARVCSRKHRAMRAIDTHASHTGTKRGAFRRPLTRFLLSYIARQCIGMFSRIMLRGKPVAVSRDVTCYRNGPIKVIWLTFIRHSACLLTQKECAPAVSRVLLPLLSFLPLSLFLSLSICLSLSKYRGNLFSTRLLRELERQAVLRTVTVRCSNVIIRLLSVSWINLCQTRWRTASRTCSHSCFSVVSLR